ncbi:4'-phosphopantetheinyl transferase superfamily protein [Streptomyces sannanensis]|uniref:4'-phosphopantetheinyl transferase superfamily protein n=1 Tax=Streptomyces sannanensis TaxID=285536 RepID=A0ABP6SFH3_9ACTN
MTTTWSGGRRAASAPALEAVERLRRSGDVHVWSWRLGSTLEPEDLLLDDAELSRVRRFHDQVDAVAVARTRAGARRAVGELLDVAPQDVSLGHRPCPGCGDRGHGPPVLFRPALPLAVSLSRTDGCGLLALCAGDRVGIDIEAVRPVDAEGLAGVLLTEREREHVLGVPDGPDRALRHFRCWTRKEAVVKAAGHGLLGAALTTLEVRPEEPGPVRVEYRHRGRASWWSVQDVPLDGPWAAAVARPAGQPGGRLVMR